MSHTTTLCTSSHDLRAIFPNANQPDNPHSHPDHHQHAKPMPIQFMNTKIKAILPHQSKPTPFTSTGQRTSQDQDTISSQLFLKASEIAAFNTQPQPISNQLVLFCRQFILFIFPYVSNSATIQAFRFALADKRTRLMAFAAVFACSCTRQCGIASCCSSRFWLISATDLLFGISLRLFGFWAFFIAAFLAVFLLQLMASKSIFENFCVADISTVFFSSLRCGSTATFSGNCFSFQISQ